MVHRSLTELFDTQMRLGDLPECPVSRTPRAEGGRHLFFRHPGGVRIPSRGIAPKLDVKGDGGLVAVPPAQGRTWLTPLNGPLPELPPEWAEALAKRPSKTAPTGAPLTEGRRNETLFKYACKLRADGASESEILAALRVRNAERCKPPLDDAEVVKIAKSAARYDETEEPAPGPSGPEAAVPSATLGEVVEAFRERYLIEDLVPLYAALGCYAANVCYGEVRQVVWLLIVAPPSFGKTTLIDPLGDAPKTVRASQITGAGALLSGSPRRDRRADATGGLLRQGGDNFVLLLKDYTTVLSMRHESRMEILGALREIHDGSYARNLGVDGGRVVTWQGKMGLLAACTPAIDRFAEDAGRMGERALILRIAERVAGLLANAAPAPLRRLEPGDERRIYCMTDLLARGRAPVVRDRYSREIEQVPGAESPARLSEQFYLMLAGLETVGVPEVDRWGVLRRITLDGLPPDRRAALELLIGYGGRMSTPLVALSLALPVNTTRRALEDLHVNGLVDRRSGGQGKADEWSPTALTTELWQGGVGSVPANSPT